MKKTSRLLFAAMIIVAMAATLFVGCKKEKDGRMTETADWSASTNDNMDAYLMTFKKKLLSAEKGGETISLEQAERDLGNLLNFDFGDANYATDVFLCDTIHAKINLTNGQIDLSQLAVTYNILLDEILDDYHNTNLPDKSIYSISCEFNETGSKDGEQEDCEITIVYRGLNSPIQNNHDTLDWRPCNTRGSCDGQFVGQKDATTVMAKWVSDAQTHMSCINGGRVYFTEVDHWEIYGDDTYDPIEERYKIYTTFGPHPGSECITHEEMEYYFDNILYYWNQAGFGNHEINYVNIRCCHFVHSPYPDYNTWQVIIRHGKPNCTHTNPIS